MVVWQWKPAIHLPICTSQVFTFKKKISFVGHLSFTRNKTRELSWKTLETNAWFKVTWSFRCFNEHLQKWLIVRNNILRNDPSCFGNLYFEKKKRKKKNTFLCFYVKQTSQRPAILWGLNTKFLISSNRSTLKNVHIAWCALHFNSFVLIYFQTAKKRGLFYATRGNISTFKRNLKCKCGIRNNLS